VVVATVRLGAISCTLGLVVVVGAALVGLVSSSLSLEQSELLSSLLVA